MYTKNHLQILRVQTALQSENMYLRIPTLVLQFFIDAVADRAIICD